MEEPDPDADKRVLNARINDVISHLHDLQGEIQSGREDEIIDRLQDVEMEIKDLEGLIRDVRADIQTSNFWPGFWNALKTRAGAITVIILITVIVLGLYVLGVDLDALLSDVRVVALAAPLSVFDLRLWIQEKYDRYCGEADQ